MDQSNNTSELVTSGRKYGDAIAEGHATMILGDIHVDNRESPQIDKRELRRQGI